MVEWIDWPLTIAAIEDFQKNNGITVGGVVGPKTLVALKKK